MERETAGQQGDLLKHIERPTELFLISTLIILQISMLHGQVRAHLYHLNSCMLHHPVGVGETEASRTAVATAERERLNKLILVTPPPSTVTPLTSNYTKLET